jgi:ABC-type spermidine/putrescine transport system permease subunit II
VHLPLLWSSIAMAYMFCAFIVLNEYTRTAYCESEELFSVYLRGRLRGGGSDAVYAAGSLMLFVGCVLFWLLSRSWAGRRDYDKALRARL